MGDDDSSFWREGGSELERERVEVVVGETSPFSMTESILKERLRPSDLDPMDDGVQRRGGAEAEALFRWNCATGKLSWGL